MLPAASTVGMRAEVPDGLETFCSTTVMPSDVPFSDSLTYGSGALPSASQPVPLGSVAGIVALVTDSVHARP